MSIIEKLKLTKYKNLAVINEPSDYDLFTGMKTTLTGDHDAIFVFIKTINEMVELTERIIKDQLLLQNGYLFFAYPKKGNKRYDTYIHRDEIFPVMKVGEDGYIENSDMKFSRMVSMDDIFTVVGIRREKKKEKQSQTASHCVADYHDNVKDVIQLLTNYPTELAFYQNLTPGYQKDWARYIFSAKQQKTRDKRHQEMVDILSKEYKSIDLYRQKKK